MLLLFRDDFLSDQFSCMAMPIPPFCVFLAPVSRQASSETRNLTPEVDNERAGIRKRMSMAFRDSVHVTCLPARDIRRIPAG